MKDSTKYFIFFTGALCISFLVLAQNFKAEFHVIDDHEIITRLNLAKDLGTIDFISNGMSDSAFRYRPAYKFIRSIEILLWGQNPSLWYLMRIIISAFCIALCSLVLSHFCSSYLAFIFSCFIFLRWYFQDVWCRLGPSEAYAVLGLVLFCRGFQESITNSLSNSFWQRTVFLLFGFIIAIFSKENFIFLAVPCFIVLPFLYKGRRYKDMFVFFLLFLLSVYAVTQIFSAIGDGKDVYARSTSFSERVALMANFVDIKDYRDFWKLPAFLILAVSTFFAIALKRKGLEAFYKISRNMMWISAGSLTLYLSQYIIYNGEYPSGFGRYNVPGMFAIEFLCLASFLSVLTVFRSFGKKKTEFYLLAFTIVVLSYGLYRNAAVVYKVAAENVNTTQMFQKGIRKIVSILEHNPNTIVIFENRSAATLEVEPLHSLEVYLNFYLDRKITYLVRMHDYEDRIFQTDLEVSLHNSIKNRAEASRRLIGKAADQCISVFFAYTYFEENTNKMPNIKTNCQHKIKFAL